MIGVVLLPEADEFWIGIVGAGAWCEDRQGQRSPVRFSSRTAVSDLILVASRSHRDDRLVRLIDALELGGSKAVGSVGFKVATILRGETDLYVSLRQEVLQRTGGYGGPRGGVAGSRGSVSPTLICRSSLTPLAMSARPGLIASHGKARRAR